MKNQYFMKDKKAQLYRKSAGGTDPDGYPMPEALYPVAAAPIWCYTRQLTQDQLFAAMQVQSEETRLFVFNYYQDIRVYDMVEYGGEWYEITRADRKDDYNTDLFVYVKVKKPYGRPENIKPYTPDFTR